MTMVRRFIAADPSRIRQLGAPGEKDRNGLIESREHRCTYRSPFTTKALFPDASQGPEQPSSSPSVLSNGFGPSCERPRRTIALGAT
jgi:hypothetical protein